MEIKEKLKFILKETNPWWKYLLKEVNSLFHTPLARRLTGKSTVN